ncbi:MAG: DUF58 domain-containing protein [Phycisphaerae bacterium]|nr:DUF58 domain-containing protein [Phycisphaerae bacterium]
MTTRRLYHVPLGGAAFIVVTILLGVASAYRPNNLLVWTFAAMLAGVLVSGVISGGMLVRLAVTRLDPRPGRVGEPLAIRYLVRHRARWWPLFDLSIEEAPLASAGGWSNAGKCSPAWLLHAGPGESAHVEGVFMPSRRGRFRFESIRAASSFPFGLLRKVVVFRQPMEFLVFPRVRALRAGVLRSLAPHGIGGVRTSRDAGPGEDFLGVREYRPGDSPRQIAWRRRAGLDDLATIERSTPSPPRLRVVLDLSRPTSALRVADGAARSGRDLEEDAITLAASLLLAAEREGYEHSLELLGFEAPRPPLRRGHWHLQRLMAVLAGVDLDRPRTTIPRADREERAATVFVHVDRVELTADRPDAIHLSATRLEDLVA